MSDHFLFLLLGLGPGAAVAAIAVGLVVNHKGTGILHFGLAAIGMWGAFTFDELRRSGDLVLPVVVLPHRIHVGVPPTGAAMAVAVAMAAILAAGVQWSVLRRLRAAPPLAGIVASVGIMLALQTLIPYRFGTTARLVPPLLPSSSTITVGGQPVPIDRVTVAGLVIVASILVALWLARTRSGLAVQASGDNELAVSLSGWSPDRLGLISAAAAAIVAATFLILVSPGTGLNPTAVTAAIVPALAVALAGRIDSVMAVTAAGLALGAAQSELTYLSAQLWWPTWALAGVRDTVPFVLIVGALALVGKNLPARGTAAAALLPPFRRPGRSSVALPVMAVVAVVALVGLDGSYRFGLITSLIVGLAALSLVVVTGMVGQPSFAQAAIAGVSGFVLSKLADGVGLPFPWSLLASALVAAVAGVVIGLPALRVRGIHLAVVTLAAAVAVEELVLRNPRLTARAGNLIPPPSVFGVDLGVRRGRDITRLEFGFLVLAVVVGATIAVRRLVQSHTGMQFLAVRTDERAAAGVGINVARAKLTAFAVSSALAGLSGALLGYSRGQLSADSFGIAVGVSWLVFAYLGGITSVPGAFVAGILAPLGIAYVLVNRLVDTGDWYLLAGGVAVALTVRLSPEGIAGSVGSKLGWRPCHTGGNDTSPQATRQGEHASSRHPARLPRRECKPLAVRHLTVRHGGVLAVRDLTFTVPARSIIGLIGPNGAGKTSAVDAISGHAAYEGQVLLAGRSLDREPPHQRARAGLARTWQAGQLFEELSVREHLDVAAFSANRRRSRPDETRASSHHTGVDGIAELLGIDGLARARPDELALCQRKLVDIGRALAVQPHVLLLDEPAAGLDLSDTDVLANVLRDVAASGPGILVIDHDLSLMHAICDDVLVLDSGVLIAHGGIDDVVHDRDVVRAYLGSPTVSSSTC